MNFGWKTDGEVAVIVVGICLMGSRAFSDDCQLQNLKYVTLYWRLNIINVNMFWSNSIQNVRNNTNNMSIFSCAFNYTTGDKVNYLIFTDKGKAIPLQALTGPEGSRKLRLPDFKTIGT
jgi:hypothetical protein